MKTRITYPRLQPERLRRCDILRWAKWPFRLAAWVCPVINLCTGGRAWSAVVLWSLLMLWTLVFSPAVIDCNRISRLIRLIVQCCILLALIDLLLAPGWAARVVPIVCFGGLAAAGVLFFTDLERQRHNLLPMLLLAVAALVGAVTGQLGQRACSRWPYIVLGALSLALLAACAAALDGGLLRELKKLFHTN